MTTEIPTFEEVMATILCHRCSLEEVYQAGDLCLRCYDELITEGWRMWFDRVAKERREVSP